MSLNDMLKEDAKWYKAFHAMDIYGECDSGCGNKATQWFGNTSAATCGSLKCIEIQNDEYETNEANEANEEND